MAEWVRVDQTWTAAFGAPGDPPLLEVRQYAAGRYTLCVRLSNGRAVMRAAAFTDGEEAKRAGVAFARAVLGEPHREQIEQLARAN
ncbi:hypothetical protein AMPC_15040 [Anaeromyxobacter paludicola]|uniref:DUF1508 domain-containing protein n=1 Tax=Anaeromyxobacter paludicola TaxID=2918171 RepID=A0ABN6N5V9_9BACT|nr:hypothetical protein AMPC_15040 [Anaeromyxobacter paludicola]